MNAIYLVDNMRTMMQASLITSTTPQQTQEEDSDDEIEYDLDEPALLLTDKGKLYICIYCGTVSLFVTHLRSHIKPCRVRNQVPVLEISGLEMLLARINESLKHPLPAGKI
jgi:hypothetical protein